MEAGPSKAPSLDTRTVLLPFIATLRSSNPITIPAETLSGAIIHFFSTLDNADLYDFVQALVISPSLWSANLSGQSNVRLAIKLAPAAKVRLIDEEVKDRYFPRSRRRGKGREWLGRIVEAICSAEVKGGSGRMDTLAALLRGLDDAPALDWGYPRMKIEEELVLGISDIFSRDADGERLYLICESIPHINVERLEAMDMKGVTTTVEKRLLETLRHSNAEENEEPEEIPITAAALSRCYAVLHTGRASDRKYAWGVMMRFCRRIHDLGRSLEVTETAQIHSSSEDRIWEGNKSALFAFLLVSSTILKLILTDNSLPSLVPVSELDPSADLAGHVLWALLPFSHVLDSSSGGVENYQRIVYGCLDVLAAKDGVRGSDKLFYHLLSDGEMSDAKAAYILVLAEELVHLLSGKHIGTLLSLAEKHVHRPQHKLSFEASHAFMLGLLRSSSDTLNTPSDQEAFFDAFLPYYLRILTKQARRGDVSSEQFRAAFPLSVESASRRNRSSVNLALSFLDQMPSTSDTRMVKLLTAPYIPHEELGEYLNGLAKMIMGVEEGSKERLDLARAAFKLVIEDLSDQVKSQGIEWWMRWRDRFEGRHRADQEPIRSRL